MDIVPSADVPWADLQAIFGTTGEPGRCSCQWFKFRDRDFTAMSPEQRREHLRAGGTTGLVAYLDGEPVGWVAVEPRTSYVRLQRSRTVWSGRQEDKDDAGVWSVTCFVTRKGHRRRGVMTELARATVAYARNNGARALEAYPMVLPLPREAVWGELYVGVDQVFTEAALTEVSRPGPRRAVMRIDFP